MARELTPTSYLMLALMGLRPWSAYQLAEQMKRGLQYVWPRAERAFYYEARRLAEEGLARADDDPVGDRPRAVYTLTDAGREALANWLADRDPSPTRIESETLARLFFAEYGTVADLQAAAESAVEQGRAALEVVRRQGRVYVESGGEFPDRLHLIALAGRFICGYGAMLMDYGAWVLEHTAGWEASRDDPDRAATMAVFEEIIAEADRRLGT